MAYRVFKRRWWLDAKCTEPGVGRKTHVAFTASEDAARRICAEYNLDENGSRIERPFGLACEFEEID